MKKKKKTDTMRLRSGNRFPVIIREYFIHGPVEPELFAGPFTRIMKSYDLADRGGHDENQNIGH